MAKSKSFIKGTFSGNVGTMNFRDRGDDMVAAARVYTNKSKGNGATDLQRAHRCKLANVVNFYKAIPALFARAYESKGKHQSDFNKFTSLNLAKATILLTKQHANQGNFVADNFTLSEGSIAELRAYNDGSYIHIDNLKSASNVDWQSSTIGAISSALLAANSWLKAGDELTMVFCTAKGDMSVEGSYPWTLVIVKSFVIDPTNSTAFSTVSPEADCEMFTDNKGFNWEAYNGGAIIVSRLNGANLLVTTSVMGLDEESFNQEVVRTDAYRTKAMNSYGYKDHALLVPGE